MTALFVTFPQDNRDNGRGSLYFLQADYLALCHTLYSQDTPLHSRREQDGLCFKEKGKVESQAKGEKEPGWGGMSSRTW